MRSASLFKGPWSQTMQTILLHNDWNKIKKGIGNRKHFWNDECLINCPCMLTSLNCTKLLTWRIWWWAIPRLQLIIIEVWNSEQISVTSRLNSGSFPQISCLVLAYITGKMWNWGYLKVEKLFQFPKLIKNQKVKTFFCGFSPFEGLSTCYRTNFVDNECSGIKTKIKKNN